MMIRKKLHNLATLVLALMLVLGVGDLPIILPSGTGSFTNVAYAESEPSRFVEELEIAAIRNVGSGNSIFSWELDGSELSWGTQTNWRGIAAGDFDGDGMDETVTVRAGSGDSFFTWDGDGDSLWSWNHPDGNDWRVIATGNFINDSYDVKYGIVRDEIVAIRNPNGEDHQIVLFRRRGYCWRGKQGRVGCRLEDDWEKLRSWDDFGDATEWKKVATGDINGDGIDEIIALREGVSEEYDKIFVWDSSGKCLFRWGGPNGGGLGSRTHWDDLSTGDFDGDGKDGFFAIRSNSGTQIFVWDGWDGIGFNNDRRAYCCYPDACWRIKHIEEHSYQVWDDDIDDFFGGAKAGDVDGDGEDEIVVMETYDKKMGRSKDEPFGFIYGLDDSGDFTLEQTFAHDPYRISHFKAVAVGDVDADGYDEVITLRDHSPNITVYNDIEKLYQGGSTSHPAFVYKGSGWVDIALGDFDGDSAWIEEELLDAGTTILPFVPYAILHDPPGDHSYSYYRKGKTISTAFSFTTAHEELDGTEWEIDVLGTGYGEEENRIEYDMEQERWETTETTQQEHRSVEWVKDIPVDLIGPGRGDKYIGRAIKIDWKLMMTEQTLVRGGVSKTFTLKQQVLPVGGMFDHYTMFQLLQWREDVPENISEDVLDKCLKILKEKERGLDNEELQQTYERNWADFLNTVVTTYAVTIENGRPVLSTSQRAAVAWQGWIDQLLAMNISADNSLQEIDVDGIIDDAKVDVDPDVPPTLYHHFSTYNSLPLTEWARKVTVSQRSLFKIATNEYSAKKLGLDTNIGIPVGQYATMAVPIQAYYQWNWYEEHQRIFEKTVVTQTEEAVGFVLKDTDTSADAYLNGDEFVVDIHRDGVFNTPLFIVRPETKTSRPWEYKRLFAPGDTTYAVDNSKDARTEPADKVAPDIYHIHSEPVGYKIEIDDSKCCTQETKVYTASVSGEGHIKVCIKAKDEDPNLQYPEELEDATKGRAVPGTSGRGSDYTDCHWYLIRDIDDLEDGGQHRIDVKVTDTSQNEGTAQIIINYSKSQANTKSQARGHSGVVFADDFEDGTLAGWDRKIEGKGVVKPSRTAKSGQYSMRVGGRWSDVGYATTTLDRTPRIPYKAEFWFRLDTASDFNGYYLWNPATAGGKPCDVAVQIHGYDRHLHFYTGSGQVPYRNCKLPVDEWLRFKYSRKANSARLTIYRSNGEVLPYGDITIPRNWLRDGNSDGNLANDWQPFHPRYSGRAGLSSDANDRIGKVGFGDRSTSWWRGYVFYDDMTIYDFGPIATPIIEDPTTAQPIGVLPR